MVVKGKHYRVTIQVDEVLYQNISGALIPKRERAVEDVISISARAYTLAGAINRARSYLDTESDNLAAEADEAEVAQESENPSATGR